MRSYRILAITGLIAVLLAGCASTHPIAYEGLASSAQRTPNTKDRNGHVPLSYLAPEPNWAAHTAVMFDRVVVYTGSDHQFRGASDADRAVLAAYMQSQFAEAMKTKFRVVDAPGPEILRVHLTLTGAQTSTPVLSTLTKIAPAGAVLNSLQTARDKQGSFSGSVSYAVEVYDSESNRLLLAFVAKQYPWAENIVASIAPLDASRAGIRTGAAALPDQLH